MLSFLFGFDGRIRRSHWWAGSFGAFFGGVFLIAIAVYGLPLLMPDQVGIAEDGRDGSLLSGVGGSIVLLVYGAMTWVQFALGVKRYHDHDKTGWWILVSLIPLGAIWVLVELGFLDGTQGPNEYGPSPKGIGGQDLGKVFS